MKRDKFEIFMYIFILLFAVWYVYTIIAKSPQPPKINYKLYHMPAEEAIRLEQEIF